MGDLLQQAIDLHIAVTFAGPQQFAFDRSCQSAGPNAHGY